MSNQTLIIITLGLLLIYIVAYMSYSFGRFHRDEEYEDYLLAAEEREFNPDITQALQYTTNLLRTKFRWVPRNRK